MSAAKSPPPAHAAAAASWAASGSAASSSTQRASAPRIRSNEMVLFDIETNIFPIEIIEFGAIIVDKFSYVELERVHTLIQPASGSISSKATKIHGISFEHVRHAPFFAAIAGRVFDALDGRVWVGHNINSFDTPHILKAFEAAGIAPPQPCATLDTLPLIRRIFGKRAGDCKMASLGVFFNLGVENHRAVDDCEMTLQALKCIALSNLLEREMPDTFPKFEEPTKAAAAAAPAASPSVVVAAPAPSASAPVDAVDALSAQLQSTVIDAGEQKPAPKQKKKKSNKKKETAAAAAADAANTGGFIDASLIGGAVTTAPAPTSASADPAAAPAAAASSSSAASAAPTAVAPSAVAPVSASAASPATSAPAAAAAPVDDWHVSISKKSIKAEKAQKEAAAAAAAKKAMLAAQKKEYVKQAQIKAQQAAAQARATSASASAASSQSAPSSQESNGSSTSGSSWSKLVKSGAASSGTGSGAGVGSGSQLSAAAPTFTPSASPKLGPAASPPATAAAAAAPAPSSAAVAPAPAKSPSAGPVSSPAAPASAPAPAPAPKPKSAPLVLSPSDLLALHAALDLYVANPSFACKLAYNGGSQPGSIRVIKSLSWLKRPTHFRAVIHQNMHGDEPVTFRTDQCISIERITL